jgi:hypothetical protein
MAFTPINSSDVDEASPIKSTTFELTKTNLDDHESRLLTVEAASSAFPPIVFRVSGGYNAVTTGALKTMVGMSIRVTGVRLLIDQRGTADASETEIDILRKRGGGSYESLFSTKPKVAASAGDDAISTNTVLNLSNVELEDLDILRLDITSAQVGGIGFEARVDYVLNA